MTTEHIEDADEFAPVRTAKVPNKRSTAHNDAMQQHIVRCLDTSGPAGATNREIVEYLKVHFDPDAYDSPVSGATSRMHREGIIVRLARQRGGRVVYVHPSHVPASAETVQPKQKKEAQVFGLKNRDSETREEVEALQRQVVILQREREEQANRANHNADMRERAERAAESLKREHDLLAATLNGMERERDEARVRADRLVEQVRIGSGHIERLTAERDELANRLSTVRDENVSLRASVGDLQTRLDQAEVEAASVPQGPRKTFTHDEQRLVSGVAKVLREKHPSDGTKDAPARITLKVSTVRGIVNAALRVVSD